MAVVQEFVEQHITPEMVWGYSVTAIAAFSVAMAVIHRRCTGAESQDLEDQQSVDIASNSRQSPEPTEP